MAQAKKKEAVIERRSGVALWRQIADRMRREISEGLLGQGGRMPPEVALAERFGVNRHTVRTAIAALVQEGVLRAEQGRGTFIEGRRRLAYPIRSRTRFSEGLAGQSRGLAADLLDHAVEPASLDVAKALCLSPGAPVIRLETLSHADGRPVSRARGWFDAERFAGMAEIFSRTRSITASFRELGLADYLRHSTTVTARHAEAGDLKDLQLSPGAIVLVTIAINVDAQGQPVQYSETRFAADRIELHIPGADETG
ncbi:MULTISPECIES: phosphonate metabolism transcriptional regulator PhnF [Nitratireductor]|uniref:phosphonate metabolism transcriptional regulator PhnF n=1 Tax=Nitratireductor TaxID=245876 RepID=UPI00261C8A0A|nr:MULTISPECIES: phosphonate metabolism transcriptional regulator PhnF [Nitratireductor]MCV0351452.1 phosphonate metabolism transcriptional regulator PhnF [Nitratireductor sp.]MDV2966738.1 phosphonate metabolism transcriptional regulator PhnF [Nitratireductor aquimarinus]